MARLHLQQLPKAFPTTLLRVYNNVILIVRIRSHIHKLTQPQTQTIKIPILILAGSEDKSAPLEGCKKMFGQLPGGEKKLVVMEGVGHWHCLEVRRSFFYSFLLSYFRRVFRSCSLFVLAI